MEYADTFIVIYKHNLWANLRLLDSCAALTEDQLNATVPGTYGSIRDTLEHIVIAERSYFSRISTGQQYHHPEDAPPMTIAQMIESVRETGEGFIAWAPRVQAKDTVQVDWDGTPGEVPKSIILAQVINHATEHRGHIMTIMTQLGIEPPDLQAWAYFEELNRSQ